MTSTLITLKQLILPDGDLNRQIEGVIRGGEASVTAPERTSTRCVDEGVIDKSVSLLGSGIYEAYLIGKEQGHEGVSAVRYGLPYVAAVLKGNVAELCEHAGCGAAKYVYGLLTATDKETFANPEALSKWYITALAREISLPAAHLIPGVDMIRSMDRHPARFVLLTGTPQFAANHLLEGPAAFTVSSGYHRTLETNSSTGGIVRGAIGLVLGIIAGDRQAQGENTAETRPVVIPIGGSLISLADLHAEAEAVVSTMGGSVRLLQGFELVA